MSYAEFLPLIERLRAASKERFQEGANDLLAEAANTLERVIKTAKEAGGYDLSREEMATTIDAAVNGTEP